MAMDPFIDTVFSGANATAAVAAANAQPNASVPPAPVPLDGFGYPVPQPHQLPIQPPQMRLYSAPPTICGTLRPGTRITECLRVTAAEFDVEFWNVGWLYHVTYEKFCGNAFLTGKSPEQLSFRSVDGDGKSVDFEIKATDMLMSSGCPPIEIYPSSNNMPTAVYPNF